MTLQHRLQFALPVVLTLIGVGLAVLLFSTDEAPSRAPPLESDTTLAAMTAMKDTQARGASVADPGAAPAPSALAPEASALEPPGGSTHARDDAPVEPAAPCAKLRHKLAYLPERTGQCDRDRCRRAGGECGPAGLDCQFACLARASDADQPCTSDRDCEGDCIAPAGSEPGERVVGRCHHLALARGCHPRVRDGVHAGVLCIE